MEKETIFIFVNTLLESYYEKMIGNAMRYFMEMVWSGELIEHGIKTKKLEELKPPMGSEPIEEDGETTTIFSNQQHGGHAPYSTNREPKMKKKYRLDPIPITYTKFLPHLIANHLVKPVVLTPLTPPFPKWYDPNAC